MRYWFVRALLLLASACSIAPSADERQVVLTVQSVFDGMEDRDAESIRPLLCENAQIIAVRIVDGQPVIRVTTAQQFLESIGAGSEPFVERLFSPEIDVRGDFAFASMGYDFHRGTTYSHHGVDRITLVRIEGRWRIASIVYSIDPSSKSSPYGGL